MTARIRMRDSAGTLRTISQLRMRDSAGTLRTITRVRMRDPNNVLRTVYDPSGASSFSASASDSFTVGFGVSTATTNSTTITPSGGTAPYSYAWTLTETSHETTDPTATLPAAATTAFQQTNMDPGMIYTAQFRCTVTDSSTPALTTTVDVAANFADTT
jgi:hypothetical protein